MSLKRTGVAVLAGAAALYAVLLIPSPDPPPPETPDTRPFAWNQNERWLALEARFKEARTIGCDRLAATIAVELRKGEALRATLVSHPLPPTSAILDTVEQTLFELAPLIAACRRRLPEYVDLITRTRSAVKRQSERWDMNARVTKDRMYRLLWGARAALEEVMLQGPPDSVPALVRADEEPSQTPFARILGVTIHSGDLLVSRAGAASSALIAIGNDYPGNFSHVALVHVDPRTSLATVIQSNPEGLQVFTLEDYLRDVKLRVMVLRPRADLPSLVRDPMLPHKAAEVVLERARMGRVPYDFEINHHDDSRLYCSEVVSLAYREYGIRLWMDLSRISAPGTRAWLHALGVKYFETQEPSDLEYDPQLRVVAEWRDPETLYHDHVDNVVTEAMLQGAARGERLEYAWPLLPAVRVLKAYSSARRALGGNGPVPEGLGATVALRIYAFSQRHDAIKRRVLALADEFRRREGYTPPEWELLRLAQQARDELAS